MSHDERSLKEISSERLSGQLGSRDGVKEAIEKLRKEVFPGREVNVGVNY